MTRFRQIVAIAAASMTALLRDRQLVFWNFAFFTVLQILFLGVLSGGDPAVRVTLTSAVVTLTIMANALFSNGVGLASARQQGVFRRFALTPVPAWATICGMTLARALVVIAAALVQVILARTLFDVRWTGGTASVSALLVLGTAAFTATGLAIAAIAPAPHVANALVNVVLVPMMAIGGTALPAAMLPAQVRDVGQLLPAGALSTGLTAALVAGQGVLDLRDQHLLLAGWTCAAAAIAVVAWRRQPL